MSVMTYDILYKVFFTPCVHDVARSLINSTVTFCALNFLFRYSHVLHDTFLLHHYGLACVFLFLR